MRRFLVSSLASLGFGLLVVLAASADSGGGTVVTIPIVPPTDHLQLAAPAGVTAGASFSVTVTAQDRSNNTSTGFRDTVHFSSSDSRAVLPADYTFTGPGGDTGTHNFSVTLETAGAQTVTVTDTSNNAITGSTGIFVADAALSASGVAVAATEGATVNAVVAQFTDADPAGQASDFSATIAWGDGASSAGAVAVSGTGGFIVNGSHTYAEEGSHAIAVRITDVGGSLASAASSATVGDAGLTASGTTIAATEGSAFTGLVASFTDADPDGAASDYVATIAWGDGQTSTGAIAANGSGGFNVYGAHTYAEEGSDGVVVTITDAGGSGATAATTATVADAALTAFATSLSAAEGASFTAVTATFTDADPNGMAGDYSASIGWGDGNTSAGTIAPNGSGGFAVTGTHAYGEEGVYSVTVTISDAGGSAASTASSVAVGDAALSASGSSVAAIEGAAFNGVVANFSDADPNGLSSDYAATITWGDGQNSAGTVTPNSSGGFVVTGGHSYAEEGSYAVSVSINDVGGSTALAIGTATVADAGLTATAGAPLTEYPGVSFMATVATFTDANPIGSVSDFSATVDWGDGSSSAGTIAATSGTFSVTGSHTYLAVGNYTVKVSITDVGGSSATSSMTARVIDFSFSAVSPINMLVGGSATATVTVNSLNGFNAPVSLTVAGAPLGVTATISPTPVTPSANGSATSTLTVTLGPSVIPTTFTLTVSGVSSPLSHATTVSVSVSATTASISSVIAQLLAAGAIDPSGIGNALTSKLSNAQAAIDRGDLNGAVNILTAFINQVKAQQEKHIAASFTLGGVTFDPAAVLITDAQSLIDHLTVSIIPDPITGSVVNTCGVAVSAATVSLKSSSGTALASTTTDVTGFYFFASTGGLSNGASYTVAVTALPAGYPSSSLPSETFTWLQAPVVLSPLTVS